MLKKLKSPTDKIGGGGKGVFKSFNEFESKEMRKSTESRKRKRSSGLNSGQN